MHILISCVGSAGDVHPFIAIGQVLARRGHEVELMTSTHFAARIEAAGLTCTPVGTEADFDKVVHHPDLWNPRTCFPVLWQAIAQRLVEAHSLLIARAQPGRTVLVGSTLAMPVRLAQETHRIPAAMVHLSPVCMWSALAPAVIPGLGDLSGWPPVLVRLIQAAIERGFIDRVVAPGFDRIRHDLGLPPVRRLLSQWINSPQRVVCAWPEWFSPKQPDWPAQAVTTGFARWSGTAQQSLAPALLDFLNAGPAPIGFTPGSAMAQGRDFFARAVASSAALNQRALLITPYADQLPNPLPPHAHAVSYAPFDALLPRLAALVHHGGIGTTAQALAAGLPQGVAPFAHDQFDNAARLVKRGVALRLSARSPVRKWTDTLARLTNDASIAAACRHHAALMAADSDAADRIADQIEALQPGSEYSGTGSAAGTE
jgi:rhamnosyltransferase subunit B